VSDPPERVLITSASIGAGHVAAGRALEAAFAKLGTETLHVDLLDYTTVPFRRLYRQAYFDLVRTAPDLVDWLGKRLDRGPVRTRLRHLRLRSRLTRLISYHLPRTIGTYRPDLMVHTHFLPAEILSTLGHRLPAPQSVVVTDFAAHRLWLQPEVSRYFVAADEVKAHLVSLGTDPVRVRVTGIPIDRRFGELESKVDARVHLGLPPDRDMVLVMAGGMGQQVLASMLERLRNLRCHVHAVIVCGRTPELQQRARKSVADADGLVTFDVRGFTEEVPRLMAAADLVIGKPGGLTTSEALAAGLPFAVVDPYPLQEEANANFLLEHGAAMRIDPLSTLELKLGRFFGDPERRQAMSEAARRLGRPQAADLVARDLIGDTPTPVPRRR
jgi:processive 1,2-diacylglycerol beta-glucosyltransferase